MIENNTTTINSKQESLEDLLIIKGISKVYKKDNKEYKVLEDINFKIKKGRNDWHCRGKWEWKKYSCKTNN